MHSCVLINLSVLVCLRVFSAFTTTMTSDINASDALSKLDIYHLLSLGIIVKDNFLIPSLEMNELHSECLNIAGISILDNVDLTSISLSKYMKQSKFGKELETNASMRGDYQAFITPQLCNDLNLKAFPKFIFFIIRMLKSLNESFNLCNDYSVQLAVFVSQIREYSILL